ncbi:RNA-dependent RNA polymerase [Cabbage cytorhabdovirus 1]|uniref:Replicase n=1 Tax=Cabbage cytorhabdovirus 1 TaxID=2051550 RepID=A0A2D2PYK8_9RHAB|nr:RNA-dependent RNA polymerase [Cabbage cytorhabdovirus 1]ATS17313.1 RNA-dependent RNA polymerase [Cabbage cytorhabdovirus 1]
MNFEIESEGIKKKLYDPLPDFHLQNPLYSLNERIQAWKNKKRLPVRLYKSFHALSSASNNLEEGNPIDLLNLFLSLPVISVHPLPAYALDDCLYKLRLDSKSDHNISTKLLKDCWLKVCANFPARLWSSMREGQLLLSGLNALSSRRPLPSGFVKISETLYERRTHSVRWLISPALLGVCVNRSNKIKLIDSDWLRSVVDVCTERFLVCLGLTLGSSYNPDHYPTWDRLLPVLTWGDDVLKKHGNSGFKLLKAFEAIVLGVLQTKSTGTFVDNHRFLNNTLADLIDENVDFGVRAKSLVSYISQFESPHHLTQLYGLHRIWGHPIVDPAKGMIKMITIGQKDIIEPGPLPEVLGVHFKKMFIKSYKDKNGVYPKVRDQGTTLEQLLLGNQDWGLCSSLDLEGQWSTLKFEKNFEIPESFNLSMIVADKSVSPTLNELKANVLTRGTVMNSELRRGVLRWINSESIDPREFLKDTAEGKFPHDHKIIGLRSKERELNPTPRMFALMSHLMRVYVVITESMLSEHILPHFPQITMTDDLLSLTKKTYTTVRNQSANKAKSRLMASKTVCMSLDFEKWNGHMRQEATLHVFKSLGELFGLDDLYHVTYDIFKESYFYLADGSYVPVFNANGDFAPEPPLSFTGHKGGQEGLRQKGWTIFTVVGLDKICSEHNCSYKIMGMGDNQVLQLTMYTNKVDIQGAPTEQGMKDMQRTLKNVFSDLLETFNSLGLPLKPLETWISEDLFVYGKYPVWKGVPLSMDIKKIMRIFSNSNQEMMTAENMFNTVGGNAQAATQASPVLGVSYMIGLFMMSVCADDLLDYHPLLGEGLLKSLADQPEWVITIKKEKPRKTKLGTWRPSRMLIRRLMSMVPRVLGGYVSFNLFGLLMRGFPDPVSLALSQLYAYGVKDADDDALLVILKRWCDPIYMPDVSLKLLIEDVSSVNLLAPVTPTAGLRRVVEKYLAEGRAIRNQEFKDLMKTRVADVEDVIADQLCKGDTLHIRLLHDIMEATIFGYIKSIVSKVTKSSTILSIAVDKSTRDPLAKVIEDERNYFKFFVWRCSVEGGNLLPDCPTDLAKSMRLNGWGKSLIGVTVAFPLSYLTKTTCYRKDQGCNCEDGFISLYLPDNNVTPKEWNTAIGRNPPYLGSMTKEKLVISSGAKIYSGEPLIKRPIELMRVVGWFVPENSNTADIIRSCVGAVSDLNPNEFRGITEGSSGSEIHRYKDSSLKHGALCSSNYLYSTRYHVSTDTFSRYAKGSQNYDMMFQANLCYIVESTHLDVIDLNASGEITPKVTHFNQSCYHCISPLDETFHDLRDGEAARVIPSNKTNRYLYVRAEKVSLKLYLPPFPGWITGTMPPSEMLRMTNLERKTWLVESVVDNICIDIQGATSESNYLTTALLDIKEHNRLFYLSVSPEAVYNTLCSRMIMMAEWRCLTSADWKVPTASSIERAITAMIGDMNTDKLSGMAGFFTWPEAMKRYYFANEIVEPDTIPVNVASACKAIKISLINLLSSGKTFDVKRQHYILLEETKTSKLVLKMMIYEILRARTSRWCCLRVIGNMSPYDLANSNASLLTCHNSHVLFPKGVEGMINRAQITMDALKKSIDSEEIQDTYHVRRELIQPLLETSCRIGFSSSLFRAQLILNPNVDDHRFVSVRPSGAGDLCKLFSLPTGAEYKYTDIVSFLIHDIKRLKGALVLGNGLGGSSNVLRRMWRGKLIISTLVDTGESIPQAYPMCNNAFKFSLDPDVDSSSMINRVNDISHEGWVKSWANIIPPDVDFCVSDIEIINPTQNYDRNQVMRKVLALKSWKMLLLKDYVYSASELESRLSIALQHSDDVKMLFSGARQRVVPEFWWVIKKMKQDPLKAEIGYHKRVMQEIWSDFEHHLNYSDPLIPEILTNINHILMDEGRLAAITGRIKLWATLPIAGSALPHKGSYTRFFGYLQRGKKPADIRWEKDDLGRKLYMSDYDQLREILLGLAASMIAPLDKRNQFVDSTQYWALIWKPSRTGIWVPMLKKMERSLAPAHIYDMVPGLSIMMRRDRLLFKEYGNTIEFKPDRNRKKLCFPITKAAFIRIEREL